MTKTLWIRTLVEKSQMLKLEKSDQVNVVDDALAAKQCMIHSIYYSSIYAAPYWLTNI